MNTSHHFIGGRWVPSQGIERLEVLSPLNGAAVGSFPLGGPADVEAAVAAARAAAPGWAAVPLADRIEKLESFANDIEASRDSLAQLEELEMGRPADVGAGFIDAGLAAFRESLLRAREYVFESVPTDHGVGVSWVVRRPVGVVAKIVPWNFTVAQTLLGLGAILASGNTVVVKPSERATLAAVRLAGLVDLPDGVLNVVFGDARSGKNLVEHPDIGLVQLTGSVEAGRSVASASGRDLRRSILELGGNDAVIVDDGVEIETVAEAVAVGAFINSGQICTSMERAYVVDGAFGEFAEALAAQARSWNEEGRIGPLVDERHRGAVDNLVTDAVEAGARILAGGRKPDGPGAHYPATVLVDVPADHPLMTSEIFGPVITLTRTTDFEEALASADGGAYGLAATVYSNDPSHLESAQRLEVGILWLNQWQGGSLDRVCEPRGVSGCGAAGGFAAYDAVTRPATIYSAGDVLR